MNPQTHSTLPHPTPVAAHPSDGPVADDGLLVPHGDGRRGTTVVKDVEGVVCVCN